MVDSSGLENRYSSQQELSRVRIPLSPFVFARRKDFFFFYWFWLVRFFRARRYYHLAEPEKKKDSEFRYNINIIRLDING